MSEILRYTSEGTKHHEEIYEKNYVIPDERTLLNSHREGTCAKCGKKIRPSARYSVEYPNGPPIYFHEDCLHAVKDSLVKVYEAAVKSILKNLGAGVDSGR